MIKTIFLVFILGCFSGGAFVWFFRKEKPESAIPFPSIVTALQVVEGLLKDGPSGWERLAGWYLEPPPNDEPLVGFVEPGEEKQVNIDTGEFKFEYFSKELNAGISLLQFEKAMIDRSSVVFSYRRYLSRKKYYFVGWITFKKSEKGWILQSLSPGR